ncbi:MAG: DUF3343 domain-containing protein [Clostridiaceae bacterium]
MTESVLVVTFHTTSEAMATEFLSREKGFAGRLIPVPRQLSAGCGIAWKTAVALQEPLLKALEKEGIEWDETHVIKL